MSHLNNILRINAVNNALGELKEKVVFIGGATISLYADRLAFEIRPTDDIDVLVEILSYSERVKLEERLRGIGFVHDLESKIVCRFKIQGIIVDIMPTDDPSIGFKNFWYPEGFKNAMDYQIDENNIVKILIAPYFIATKLEAFKGRGNDDGRTSKDFEDIVFVLENRKTIWEELKNSDLKLQKYLQAEFNVLLANPYIEEWIGSHLERGSEQSTFLIIEEMKKFVE